MYKVMCLDIGTKRIGIALSDYLLMLATGHSCIARTPENKAIDLTSNQAEENLRNRKVDFKKNKGLVDIESACIILEQYLSRK